MPPIQGLAQRSGVDYADSGSRQGDPKIFRGRGSSGRRLAGHKLLDPQGWNAQPG